MIVFPAEGEHPFTSESVKGGFLFPRAHMRSGSLVLFALALAAYCGAAYAVISLIGVDLSDTAWFFVLLVGIAASGFIIQARALPVVVCSGRVTVYRDSALSRIGFDAPYDAFATLVVESAVLEETADMTSAYLQCKPSYYIAGGRIGLVVDLPRAHLTDAEERFLRAVADEMGVPLIFT